MKTLLTMLCVTWSLLAHCADFDKKEVVALYTLQVVLNEQTTQVDSVLLSVEENSKSFSELGWMDFLAKKELKRKNCEQIKKIFGFTMLAIKNARELSKSALEKIGQGFDDVFESFLADAKKAKEDCQDISLSHESLLSASINLDIAYGLLDEVMPEYNAEETQAI